MRTSCSCREEGGPRPRRAERVISALSSTRPNPCRIRTNRLTKLGAVVIALRDQPSSEEARTLPPVICTGTAPSVRSVRGAQNGVFWRVADLLANARHSPPVTRRRGSAALRQISSGTGGAWGDSDVHGQASRSRRAGGPVPGLGRAESPVPPGGHKGLARTGLPGRRRRQLTILKASRQSRPCARRAATTAPAVAVAREHLW